VQIFKLYNIIEENNMNILDIHIIYIGIIFLILIKSFVYKNEKKEIKEDKKPSLEYYEWKRLYFKIIVLHEFKEIYDKKFYHKFNKT
jgi:hypothetical protein